MRYWLSFVILTAILAAPCAETAQAQWGNLKGQFLYGSEGTTVPTRIDITPTKDEAYCGKQGLQEEQLVVNPANRGIKNVVVYLYVGRGQSAPQLHPDYAASAKDEVKLDNKGCRFEPHVALLRTSQTLLIGNSDPVGHNTQVTMLANPSINPIVPAGGELRQQFSRAERFPSPVKCSIHPWMSGYLLIQDHPFMAVSDEEGNFEIQNLPAGKWTFQVWQEKSGFLPGATVDGKKQAWRRGRMDVTITAGQTTENTFVLDPASFAK
jgi:hypothetical protein